MISGTAFEALALGEFLQQEQARERPGESQKGISSVFIVFLFSKIVRKHPLHLPRLAGLGSPLRQSARWDHTL